MCDVLRVRFESGDVLVRIVCLLQCLVGTLGLPRVCLLLSGKVLFARMCFSKQCKSLVQTRLCFGRCLFCERALFGVVSSLLLLVVVKAAVGEVAFEYNFRAFCG